MTLTNEKTLAHWEIQIFHFFNPTYCSRISKILFPCAERKNTKIQKYKIRKYSIWPSARKTQHVAYFWKKDCSRVSKMILLCAERKNTKIQKYKNTNTQIQKYTNTLNDQVLERPIMWYIFEKRIVQGYQKLYWHMSNA